ncbi:MAG TPA: hypothetical protein P5244_13200, partial [Syntrophales bacterium]|nr:hypothetical protein [Syntrophales bacterium]
TMTSASDLTIEHYQRSEVRETIIDLCKYGDGLRGLNGGDFWYVHKADLMRLRGPADFDDTISKERSLYMTADVFDPVVFDIWERRIEGRDGAKPENTIGERGDLIAYSLFADIDAVKDPDDEGDEGGKPRSKLYHKSRIAALEAAASFMVRYLKERGISEAVGVLFSGQGIYVMLSPELSDMSEVRALPAFDRDELDEDFKIWLMAYNDLLADIEKAFFEAYPEHKGRVKFDKLNHIKRKVKCLLSIHKTLPFAVVPLDRDDIRIDLEAARIPLSSETVASARAWLSTWKAAEGERSALVKLLEPYRLRAAEDVTAKAKTSGEIRRSSEPIPVEAWCPFYRALLEFPGGAGAHRVCGALATWLYQAGWSEEEAFQLWGPVADRCDVETRIFYTSYGVINSPNCETIKKRGAGYPVLRFGELGLCRPDEKCKGCHWPGDYGTTAAGAVRVDGGGEAGRVPFKDLFDLSPDDVLKVVRRDKDTDEPVEWKFSAAKADAAFRREIPLKMASWDPKSIWWCNGGIWRPDGDRLIAGLCDDLGDEHSNGYQVNEVLRRLRVKLGWDRVDFDVAKPYLIATKNGYTIDLRTGEARAIDPDDLISMPLNANYDPSAKCPTFIKFLSGSCANDIDRMTLIDHISACAIAMEIEYILFLLGHGSNGKKIYQGFLLDFFGVGAGEAIGMEELTKSRFAVSFLMRARFCIGTETNPTGVQTEMMKRISGGDWISADIKNVHERARFRPFTQLMYDTNSMPVIEDNSAGWQRRFTAVSMPFKF